MHSMTGYGRAQTVRQGNRIVVEIQSINKRQAEIILNLPMRLAELEAAIREIVDHQIHRGRVTVNVSAELAGTTIQPVLNRDLARTYYRDFRQLQQELGAAGEITIATILSAPGVIGTPRERSLPPAIRELALQTLRAALAKLLAMRKREGNHLKKDLSNRIAQIGKTLHQIGTLQPRVVPRYRAQLQERIKKLEVALDDERLRREIVFFAERSDFSEELTRIESHLVQFTETCGTPNAIGRTLDFLSQEIGRELNTLSAKANDAEISQLVVHAKAEMEKIREQIQNIE
jgi:uncharacterized protein (TIGR00255 family)